MRSVHVFALAAACSIAGAGAPLTAQRADEKPRTDLSAAAAKADRLTLETFLEMETVSDPQLSPDGSQIIYTRGWVDKMNDRRESALWIMNADGSRNRFLAKGSGARWSPTGDRIAYTSQGEPRGSQVFVRWMDAEGATSQVTRVDQGPSAIAWSPDGTQLSFTALVEERNNWPITLPKAPAGAKWTEAAAHRRTPQLSARPDRLHRQRLPTHLRRSGDRRHTAADHQRRISITREATGRRTERASSSAACGSPPTTTSGASRRSTRSTWRTATSVS